MNKLIMKIFCVVIAVLTVFFTPFTASAVDVNYMEKHGEEGEQLWNDYLMALKPVSEGKYPQLLQNYDGITIFYGKFESLTKRSRDEYISMSDYDKLLWSTSFLCVFVGEGVRNSWEDWHRRYGIEKSCMERYITDDEERKAVSEAYTALMKWSYDYYDYTGGFYNFIEGKDSFDYINEYYDTDSAEKKDTEDKTTTSSVSSKSESSEITSTSEPVSLVSSDRNDDVKSESEGIWSGVVSDIKSHIVTIIIAILFLIALAYIVISKKRSNMYGSDD